jgi:Protein of unknown function (DUF3551)
MRRTLLCAAGLAALLVLFASVAASAQEHAWCAEYSEYGARNCGFDSLDQCRAALTGNGGHCLRNSFYAAAEAHRPLPAPQRRPARP